MQYVMFGNSGMKVSRLALGAMTLASRLGQQGSARVVDEAIEKGVNFIDTADSYRGSEEMLGKILSPEKRDKVYLATKVFRRFCRDRNVGRNSRVNIMRSLERSLRLLNTDYVDLYQLHHPDDETPVEETLATLDRIVQEGKARYVGVSNHYAWQMAHMLGLSESNRWEPIISYQANYNILDRQMEMEAVAFCSKFNIAVICYGPLCGGILTGKYAGLETMPEGSRAAANYKTREYLDDPVVQEILGHLDRIAKENELQMNHLALLWLLSKPHATTLLLGGSKPEHFQQAYDILDREVPNEVVEEIDRVSQARVFAQFSNQPWNWGPRLTKRS